MDPCLPVAHKKCFDPTLSEFKQPINLLTLYGKSSQHPNLAFHKVSPYQIRTSSINGLPEMVLLVNVAAQSQSQQFLQQVYYNIKSKAYIIFFQVDDCFRLFQHGGLDAFMILFPTCCKLTDVDKQMLSCIYSKYGVGLIDQTYFLILGYS